MDSEDESACNSVPANEANVQTLKTLQYVNKVMQDLAAKRVLESQDQQDVEQALTLMQTLLSHFASSGSERSSSDIWEKRFDRLEQLINSRTAPRSYSAVTQRFVPQAAPPGRTLPVQAIPTLTIKLDCTDSNTLGPAGLKQELIDKIPPRNGDGGVSRMRFLGNKSLLIVTRDKEAKDYLVSQIGSKLKGKCTIGTPFYKMPTVRIEGLENVDSGEELKSQLDKKFPTHCEKIKVILLHKIRRGNQQAAIVRVPKEVYKEMMDEPEMYFKYSRLTIKKYTHVTMCYKCQLYGHISSNCPNATSCSYCAGEHSHKECTNREKPEQLRCAVCQQHNAKNGTDKAVDHRCHTQECAVHRKAIENTEAQTEY
ncbi:hypothetical protein HDE_00985 [Halotydeus destructor]|nr:hypothetical protein HDE_00985 [Halotydeus destructor]